MCVFSKFCHFLPLFLSILQNRVRFLQNFRENFRFCVQITFLVIKFALFLVNFWKISVFRPTFVVSDHEKQHLELEIYHPTFWWDKLFTKHDMITVFHIQRDSGELPQLHRAPHPRRRSLPQLPPPAPRVDGAPPEYDQTLERDQICSWQLPNFRPWIDYLHSVVTGVSRCFEKFMMLQYDCFCPKFTSC